MTDKIKLVLPQPYKQVKLLRNVNDMLEAIVEVRSKTQASVNKQSVVNDLIMGAFKKECKNG